MIWNWQQADRPNFTCDEEALRPLENKLLHSGGASVGATTHLSELFGVAVTSFVRTLPSRAPPS
jgi:hypothetical protein